MQIPYVGKTTYKLLSRNHRWLLEAFAGDESKARSRLEQGEAFVSNDNARQSAEQQGTADAYTPEQEALVKAALACFTIEEIRQLLRDIDYALCSSES